MATKKCQCTSRAWLASMDAASVSVHALFLEGCSRVSLLDSMGGLPGGEVSSIDWGKNLHLEI